MVPPVLSPASVLVPPRTIVITVPTQKNNNNNNNRPISVRRPVGHQSLKNLSGNRGPSSYVFSPLRTSSLQPQALQQQKQQLQQKHSPVLSTRQKSSHPVSSAILGKRVPISLDEDNYKNSTTDAMTMILPPPRKRERLTHLTVDEKMDRRKLKNRVAAQTARDRKKVRVSKLEETLYQLSQENQILTRENERLRRENVHLKAANPSVDNNNMKEEDFLVDVENVEDSDDGENNNKNHYNTLGRNAVKFEMPLVENGGHNNNNNNNSNNNNNNNSFKNQYDQSHVSTLAFGSAASISAPLQRDQASCYRVTTTPTDLNATKTTTTKINNLWPLLLTCLTSICKQYSTNCSETPISPTMTSTLNALNLMNSTNISEKETIDQLTQTELESLVELWKSIRRDRNKID